MEQKYIPELLVPAGDFNCLRAGVQNGANAIYFGASSFSARANAKNFNIDELKEAIEYCKLRNVKTNLTINTLLTDSEFDEAVSLAKTAYEFGIDAIIVQDLGFAKYLIKHFPDLAIHASTQMTVHNLEGVLELEKLGFKRVVLSRELPINEIEYIRNNCNIELEVFIHGALCISYSGQCLFSSLVGGRSGNRGKCAQPCRLPYELLEAKNNKETSIDKGFLLSPRDLCSLDFLAELIKCGVSSFKIEGRMKTPEYVATVTRIYRKYIDKIVNDEEYTVSLEDKKELLQVFNRGGFSSGHLSTEPNTNLVFPSKPNNMGIYLGNISNYNPSRGYITLETNEIISIGDTISIDGETGKYTVSELMLKGENIKSAPIKSTVKLGRMKGNIKIGSKVYKLSDKLMVSQASATYAPNANLKKIPLDFKISIKKGKPIVVSISTGYNPPFYNNLAVEFISDIVPESSKSSPITAEKVISQFSKLGNTPYSVKNIDLELDDNLFVNVSLLNDVRRKSIELLVNKITKKSTVEFTNTHLEQCSRPSVALPNRTISVLLEQLNLDYDYSNLEGCDNVYIPLKYFINSKYSSILQALSNKFHHFVYMPTIMKANYKNLLLHNLTVLVKKYNISGFVISNISEVVFLKSFITDNKYRFIANYTMNIFNRYTIDELGNIGINVITPSIESNLDILNNICFESPLPVELISYGRSILMNSSYCLLGKTNKCYPECKMKCKSNNTYYLKDRLGLKFRIIPDQVQTVTSIYNSKIMSIDTTKLNVDSVRIDILDESIEQINTILSTVKSGKKLTGNEYTNGNLNREI